MRRIILSIAIALPLLFGGCSESRYDTVGYGGGSSSTESSSSPDDSFVEDYFAIEGASFVEDAVPAATTEDTFTITANSQALAGGFNMVQIDSESEYDQFIVGVTGQSGYYLLDADDYLQQPGTLSLATRAGSIFTYVIDLSFGTGFSVSIEVYVIGLKDLDSDGVAESVTPPVTQSVEHVESASGDLTVNLTFSNAKDIDLHLIEPDGNIIYYGNREEVNDSDGNQIYGLDHDSNPSMPLDELNNENIVVSGDYLQNGTYKVVVDMYTNWDPTIATSWSVVARYKGAVITPVTGSNPASGIYAIGFDEDSDDDDPEAIAGGQVVMTFNITDANN